MTEMVDSMGLTLFCNSMVEELYYMRKNSSVSKKLEKNCQKAITEFESLKWPLDEKTYSNVQPDLFNTNLNIKTLEEICVYYKQTIEQMIDGLIKDLKYVISKNPIEEKLETAYKLQKFFDDFGDVGFYATRDILRN